MVDHTAEALQEDDGAIAAAAVDPIGQAPILGFDELDLIRMHGSSPQHMIAVILLASYLESIAIICLGIKAPNRFNKSEEVD
jgi:hypothetical protein